MTRGRRRSTARAMERSTTTTGRRCCGRSHGEGPEEEHRKGTDGACVLVLDVLGVLGEEEDGGEGCAHQLFDRMP